MEVPYSGNFYTWINNKNGNEAMWEKLDSFLCNPEWTNSFKQSCTSVLPTASDHTPIILDTKVRDKGWQKKKKKPPSLRTCALETKV